jgi:hypothetical protein
MISGEGSYRSDTYRRSHNIRRKQFHLFEKEGEKKHRRSKKSTWFLTINTNRFPENNLAQYFHDALLAMVSERGLEEIVKWEGIPSAVGEYHHAQNTHMVRSDARVVTEVNNHPKGGRVHGHVLLAIEHFSKIRLDRDSINDFVVNFVNNAGYSNTRIAGTGGFGGLTRLYIHWKIVGVSNFDNIDEYMMKYTQQAQTDPSAAYAYDRN